MGIILGALGGAGEQLANIGATRMKNDMEMDNIRLRDDLETKRQQTLELFRDKVKNAPMDRLTTKAKEYAGQDVPVEAGPTTRVTGYDPKAVEAGPAMPGFQGDIGIIRSAIAKLPDGPDKQAATAQLERQIGADTEFDKGIVAGAKRKRTSDEALDAAAEDAKINDVGAYATYEEKIGKPKREERKIDNAEKKAEAGAKAAIDREEARTARTLEMEDRKDARQEARLQAAADAAERRSANGGVVSREERIRYTSLFSDAGRRLGEAQKALNALRKDPMYKIAEKGSPQFQEIEDLRANIKGYEEERRLYQSMLAGSQGGAPRDEPASQPTAASSGAAVPTLPKGARQIGTSGGKPVYETPDGKRFIPK
jgi:hypothetical protein